MNAVAEAPKVNPNAPTVEKVLAVRHWTDNLFSFRITRPESFRFRSGEFIMLGLPQENGKPLLRAYSVASPSWDEELEFFSIKVPDGPLTSRLQKIQVGDEILLGRKPVGTLVLDALLPGKRLYLFSTGTGIAPFASVIRDLEPYEKFDQIILTHTCRRVAELEYGKELITAIKSHELLGDMTSGKLVYYESVTREPYYREGRMTALIESGRMFEELGIPRFDPATDRAMICGALELNNDMKKLLEAAGLKEGANSQPAEFVVEKAFVG